MGAYQLIPQIVIDDPRGRHNLNEWTEILDKAKLYQDLSTIIICPSRGSIPAKVVRSWFSLITPMNQKVIRMFAIGLEVGAAYSSMIERILAEPELSSFKYILTLEEDNGPPPDGLLKLYENTDKFDVIGGLYWLKGEAGVPMAFGVPELGPDNSFPLNPEPNSLVEVNSLGMGFTLFKLNMFRDERFKKPWFETLNWYDEDTGMGRRMTQDVYFFQQAKKMGYRLAVDTRVKVGHYDLKEDRWW